jgi:AraC-like DNA-binding protein
MNTQSQKLNGITLHHVYGNVSRDFWNEHYHAHDHAEIFVHVLGKMDLFIENNIYSHHGNEIRVYAPQELHFGKADFDQNMEWYQISIDGWFLAENPPLANIILNRPKGQDNVFISKKQETVLSLLNEIFQRQDGILSEYYNYANVIKILCILNDSDNNIKVEMGRNESLQQIMEETNKNIVNIQNVRDIAALSHFSTSYIHQTFKKHLNITPHQYVLMKKMSLAKEFLAKGETVSEACFNAGFDNYAYFITCFKKIFGVTPGKHKKSTD